MTNRMIYQSEPQAEINKTILLQDGEKTKSHYKTMKSQKIK